MKLTYNAVFTPLLDVPGGYCVKVPDLPGCITQGNTLVEALEMAVDAACGWVLDEFEDGSPAPSVSPREEIALEDGEFINLLVLDMDAYAEKYGNRAVRKNCTIPAWLNTAAESKGINFSQSLQNALIDELGLDRRISTQ